MTMKRRESRMMWIRRLQKKRLFHLPMAAYLAALFTVTVCAAAGRKDYHIEIRHTLREYADNQAVLAVLTEVLPDDLKLENLSFDEASENRVTYLVLADKWGRIKCIRTEQWDELVDSYEEAHPDIPIFGDPIIEQYRMPIMWSWWNSQGNERYGDVEDQMMLAAEIAELYDVIMQDNDIPYLDRRIYLSSHYLNRLINETEPTRKLPGINPYPLTGEDEEIKKIEKHIVGSVVASWEGKHVPTCRIVGVVETLKYLDSPTTKYAIKKLDQLAEIGVEEMKKQLSEQGAKEE